MSKSILKLDKQSDIASSAYAAGVTEAINAVQADVNQNEADADSAIEDEADARAAADAAIDTAYKAADATLQGNIDVETGRIDAILAASEADKDSFAEIVTLINSVDTENDQAFAAYVLSNDQAVADMDAAYKAADVSLQGNIDAEATTARAAESANATAISNETTRATAAEAALLASHSAYVTSNNAALASEIASTNTDFANAATDRAAVRSEFAAADSAIDTAYKAADATLQSNIDAEETRATDAEAAIQSALDVQEAKQESERAAMDAAYKAADNAIEIDYKAEDAAIRTEFAAADSSATTDRAAIRSEFAAADSALSSSVASRMASDEAKMDAVLLAADADKDSFAEIVSLINSVDTENDDALAAYVLSNNNAVADLQGELDTQEAKQESERAAMDTAYKAADAAATTDRAAIRSEVSDSVSDLEAADSAIDTAYKAADAAMDAAYKAADAAIDAAYKAADATLTENLESETARAEAAEAALDAKIAAEQVRAEAAEGVLTTSVNSLIANSKEDAVDSMKEIVEGHNAAMAILKVAYARHQVQTAQPDGEATEFMFDKLLMAGSEQLYLNGQLMEVNLDYIVTGGEEGSLGFVIDRGDDEGALVEGDRIVVYGVSADLSGVATLAAPSVEDGDDADGEG